MRTAEAVTLPPRTQRAIHIRVTDPSNPAKKIVRIAPQMYSIDDPATMRDIYGVSSPFPKAKWYDAWGDPRIPNHNLFSARDRAVHGVMRRKVANMYAMSTVKSYEPHVDSCIDLLLQRLDGFAESGEAFDLQVYLRSYAFDVIGAITVSFRPIPSCMLSGTSELRS
jgi:cytochrome P450